MGEMADDFLEDVMDAEELRLDIFSGNLSILDAYDMGLIDEDGSVI